MTEDKVKLLHALRIDRGPAAPTPPRTPGWRRLGRVVALILAALGGGAAVHWLAPPPAAVQHAATAPPAISAAAPASAPAPAPGGLVASGYIVARRKATVAAEVTGKLVAVEVEEGMVVHKGQVLAQLDSVLAERDVALTRSRALSAQAAVDITAAQIKDAEATLDRTRTLSRRNYATAADLIKAEADVEGLRAQLRKARADAETARLDVGRSQEQLAQYTIRAPFDGVVVDKSAQPGEMISPLSSGGFTRTGVCTLVDMDSIEIEVDVNEAFIGRVAPRQKIDAVLDAYPDWTIPGSVIAIVPTANREKATVKVRIALDDKDPRILPDMAVKVTFRDAGTPAAAPRSPAPQP